MNSEATAIPAMKFCKDCRYFSGFRFAMCTHPEAGRDLVTGGSDTSAFGMRNGECGPDAILFEPGPSDAVIKGKEISRLAHRDASLIMAGILLFAVGLVLIVAWLT